MSRAFSRILRLRTLLEELSRLELERHVQRAAQIERSMTRENTLAAASRREFYSLIARGSADERSLSEADSAIRPADETPRELLGVSREVTAMRTAKLQFLSGIEAKSVAERTQEFHLRRKERHQVQTLLEHEATLEKIEQERTDQRELDDWYALREAQKRKKALRTKRSG